MSEPHTILEPVHIPEQLTDIIGSILGYIAENEFDDLCQRCVEDQWTLDQAREHVAFMGLLAEWYLAPSEDPNPERYALRTLKQDADPDDYERFHPSLKIK